MSTKKEKKLINLISKNNLEEVRSLLDNTQTDIKTSDYYNGLLDYACQNNQVTMVDLILNHKTAENLQTVDFNCALIDAISCDGVEVFKLLWNYETKALTGKKEKIKDIYVNYAFTLLYSLTPLMLACEHNSKKIINVIINDIYLKDNINVNIQDEEGNTAFMIICEMGDVETAMDFLRSRAVRYSIDINVKNNNGKTARCLARENKNNIFLVLNRFESNRRRFESINISDSNGMR